MVWTAPVQYFLHWSYYSKSLIWIRVYTTQTRHELLVWIPDQINVQDMDSTKGDKSGIEILLVTPNYSR